MAAELPASVLSTAVALDVVESVVDRGAAVLFDHYLESRVVSFGVGRAVEDLFSALGRATVAYDCEPVTEHSSDAGTGLDQASATLIEWGFSAADDPLASPPAPLTGLWECEPEPIACPIDASAPASLKVRPKRSAVPTVAPPSPVVSPFSEAQPAPPSSLDGSQIDGGSVTKAFRPMSPTEADTLFLQRELAIPERPSSVADGSRRPRAADGPDVKLRQEVLAREKAEKERSEALKKREELLLETEAEAIRNATTAINGTTFTTHDDGSIMPVGAGKKKSGKVETSEVAPGIALVEQSSPDALEALAHATSHPRSHAVRQSASPMFGGRRAREQKRSAMLRRSREGTPEPDTEFYHPTMDEQPSLVDSLRASGMSPGAKVREQGRGELDGGEHPRESTRSRGPRSPSPGEDQSTHGASPHPHTPKGATRGPAASGSMASLGKRPSAHAVALKQSAMSPTTVSKHAPPQAGFQASTERPVPIDSMPVRSELTDDSAHRLPEPVVRERRGRGGFSPSPSPSPQVHAPRSTAEVSPKRGGVAHTTSPASGSKAERKAVRDKERQAALGESVQYPRDRLPRNAKARPEEHQPPPVWPGTSRFDPRAEAGPLGAAGIAGEVPEFGESGSLPSLSQSGKVQPPGAEWGASAARRVGGAVFASKTASQLLSE
jgi:hypothetical protein